MLTTNRFQHIKQLVCVRNLVAQRPADADDILRTAIVGALPPQYAQVYRFVKSHRGEIASSMVCTAFRLAQNHSAGILNELWQFGLLERTPDGNRFLYS